MIADRRTVAALALLGVAAAACGRSPAKGSAADPAGAFGLSETQRARIHVQAVTATTFRPTIDVSGTVAFDGDHSTQVLAPISGPVSRVLVEPGAHVEAGQALAYVASPDFAAALAAYRKAQGAAVNALRIAVRDSALYAHDALARQELEQAQTDAASAAADRDATLDQLRAIGVDSITLSAIQENRTVQVPQGVIRAPLPGVVVERLITPGQLLQAGQTPCFTVARLSTMWVMANVFEHDLPDVAIGDPADIHPTAGDMTFHGMVDYIGALVNPDTRATAVRIVTGNPGGGLKRDMYVQITIRSRHARQGLLVPVSAVLRDAENLPFVFVTQPDSSYARRNVQLGTRVGDQFEVTGGVVAGDRVITEGGLFLQFAENQ
jgi:cobalt-zinc-cadmium efflux system membrane fusion protein